MKRVVSNMRNPDKRLGGRELTVEEINEAENDVIRNVQREPLSEDYRLVKAEKQVTSTSQLAKLNPRIDQDCLLRLHS